MPTQDEPGTDPIGAPQPYLAIAFGAGVAALAGLFIAAAHAVGHPEAGGFTVDAFSCCTSPTLGGGPGL